MIEIITSVAFLVVGVLLTKVFDRQRKRDQSDWNNYS